MQKKLIALAIAGLSTAAFAQSNVTISGRFAVGAESISGGGATAGAAGNYTSRFRMVDNNSNIRFAGEEALGNGTSAWFQVESAIGTTNNNSTTTGMYNATNNTTLGTRNTALGLKGAWGTALAGKWDVHYNSMAAVDINGFAGGLAVNTNSINLLNNINGVGIAGSGRDNNAIAYVSPDWSGFSFLLAYTTVGQSDVPLLAKKDGGWQFKPSYVNGPIALVYSYLAVNGAGAGVPVAGVSTGNGSDVRSNRLGGAYTFPMGFKIGLAWDKSKQTNNGPVAGATWNERTAWALPMSYTTGAHKVSFTYAKTNDTNTQAGTISDSSAKNVMLGYEYTLSKRTSVGVSYSQINNGTRGSYDFWHPSSNITGTAGAVLNPGVDPRSFAVNMTHTF